MPESFGARLRQRREQQHISLATIADQTKISLSLLEAMERDDVSHWPGGIFRRAFIRAYAHAIGLEPDVVVREFLTVHPDPVEEVVSTVSKAEAGAEGTAVNAGPPTRVRYLIGSAIAWFSAVRSARRAENEDRPLADVVAAKPPPPPELDLTAAAHLCTELGRIDSAHEIAPLLEEAARILDAVGLIIWGWDPQTAGLTPVLAHGYSDKVLAQLPTVGRDADNATAAAFRSTQTCVVNGRERRSGAVAAPLMTPEGCIGVLAIELQHGSEQRESVRALVTILAAQLARRVGAARIAETADLRLA